MDIRSAWLAACRYRLCITTALSIVLLALWAPSAKSSPYADPGDDVLRHDLEYLADRGVINIPITSWPVMWADINAVLAEVDSALLTDSSLETVVLRLRQRLARERLVDVPRSGYRVSGSDNSRRLRLFEDTPRATAELEGEISYTSHRFASRVRLAFAGNAADDRAVRPDGTYVARIFGNTAISLGWQDKWWGPGWGGALGLSTNARPIPGLLIQRNLSERFDLRLLRWLGPWSYQVTMGRLETDRAVANPYIFGMRMTFKPLQRLELGVSRTAQWGGEGRTENFSSFIDMLLGRDNEGSDGLGDSTEPGNQLAGFDARWTVTRGRWPVAVYGQLMGEDEAGGFPSKYLGQFGVLATGAWGDAGAYVAARIEYSDTTCQFNEESRIFDCAYNNSQFPSGYRFRGQAIGHSTDNDTSQILLNAQVVTHDRQRFSLTLRRAKLNRGGAEDPANSITPLPRDLTNIELTHERPFWDGMLYVGVGYDATEDVVSDVDADTARVFVSWSRAFF